MTTLDELTYSSTPDEVVDATVRECKARGYTKVETVGVVADQRQESGSRMVWSPNRKWFGYFQQDTSYPDRANCAGNIRGFLNRLDVKRRSPNHGDIWANIFWLQQGPNWPSAEHALRVGRIGYLREIKSQEALATRLVDQYWDDRGAPTPVVVPVTIPKGSTLVDPITDALWTARNRYVNRDGMLSPMWVGCHTSESKSSAVGLRNYCEGAGVSYNRLVDDRRIVGMVRDGDGPWAAVGANNYALHICWSTSFASWTREQWLDPDNGDGFDERNALRLGAKQIAFWVQESREVGRPIPVEWIGGRQRPPWGLNGICGHVDFGQWGGGHTDPGVNFPVDTMLSDVRYFLSGQEQPPIVIPPPIGIPGTNPDKYADWMLYQGNPRNDVDKVMRVQSRLKAMFSYGKNLAVDGDFGPATRQAVTTFQDRSGIVADGIVGPMTAGALKP